MGYKLNRIMMRPNGVEKQVRPSFTPVNIDDSFTGTALNTSIWTSEQLGSQGSLSVNNGLTISCGSSFIDGSDAFRQGWRIYTNATFTGNESKIIAEVTYTGISGSGNNKGSYSIGGHECGQGPSYIDSIVGMQYTTWNNTGCRLVTLNAAGDGVNQKATNTTFSNPFVVKIVLDIVNNSAKEYINGTLKATQSSVLSNIKTWEDYIGMPLLTISPLYSEGTCTLNISNVKLTTE